MGVVGWGEGGDPLPGVQLRWAISALPAIAGLSFVKNIVN